MRSLSLLLIALLLLGFTAAGEAEETDPLLPDSLYSPILYINKSPVPGPAVIILGGVHGDEPAGSLAAEKLCQLAIKRGTLLVIPRVNHLALAQGIRSLPETGDMNRAYPGSPDGSPGKRIAYAICALIERYNVSMLIDLHEGRAFHRLDKSSVGQTILFAANDRSTLLAMAAADHINQQLPERHKHFSLNAHPVPHSAAHYTAERYQIAAFTLETAALQPLDDRTAQHVTLVSYLLRQEGLL